MIVKRASEGLGGEGFQDNSCDFPNVRDETLSAVDGGRPPLPEVGTMLGLGCISIVSSYGYGLGLTSVPEGLDGCDDLQNPTCYL